MGPLQYGKHFMGPFYHVAADGDRGIVSHLARLLSLTVRLWVNMLVSELLYVMFLGLTLSCFFLRGQAERAGLYPGAASAAGAAVIFILLHIFVAFVQAFVFTLLPIIYLGGAVAEEH